MKRLDRIKTVLATVIVASVVISFVWLGKDHDATRWLAAGGIIIWLATMYLTSRKEK